MSKSDAPQSLHITHHIPASPERVFDALTNPDVMKDWMYPDDTTYNMNVYPGGEWSITSRRDGTEYVAKGEYLEVDVPHRMVYTYAMPQFSPNSDTLTIELKPDGEGCLVSFTQSGVDIAGELAELKAGETSASEAGWRQGFEALEAFFK